VAYLPRWGCTTEGCPRRCGDTTHYCGLGTPWLDVRDVGFQFRHLELSQAGGIQRLGWAGPGSDPDRPGLLLHPKVLKERFSVGTDRTSLIGQTRAKKPCRTPKDSDRAFVLKLRGGLSSGWEALSALPLSQQGYA
jgi:hypothetical protein